MKKTRVAFITLGDADNRGIWSGIPHYMYKALMRDFDDVVLLGPYKPKTATLRLINGVNRRINNATNLFYKKVFNRSSDSDMSMIPAIIYARYFSKQLREKGPFDLIIAPASSTAVCFLNTKTPILNVSDATIKLLDGYYEYLSGLSTFSIRKHIFIEKLALQRAVCNLYSSSWAANSAINDYSIDPVKTRVIPFGANIDRVPTRESIMKVDFSYKLLFLGVDWIRKGGSIAYECLKELIAMGFDVQLIVCGCVVPNEYQHNNLVNIPFLDKNNADEYKQFVQLLEEADLLLLPTRAECYGVVFCEASAYGVPSVTTDTGGVAGVVENGVNGFRLPIEASGKDYALLISEIYSDKQKYLNIRASTRNKYDKQLNWTAWSLEVKKLFIERVDKSSQQ